MSRDRQYLLDMLQSAQLIETYTEQVAREAFMDDVLLQDAVIRRLLVTAEAARQISDEMQQTLSEISWREINGMRNRLVHEYDAVDLNIVWTVVQLEMLTLIRTLKSHTSFGEESK